MSRAEDNLQHLKKAITSDLYGLEINWYKDSARYQYVFKVYDNLTNSHITMDFDEEIAYEADYLANWWRSVRSEIITKRGEHYSKTYKSPVAPTSIKYTDDYTKYGYGTYTVPISTTPFPPSHYVTGTPPFSGGIAAGTGTIGPTTYAMPPGPSPTISKELEELLKSKLGLAKAEPPKLKKPRKNKKRYEGIDNYGIF